MGKSIFVISGEESGDLHGASLIASLKKLIPALKVAGMGGERMRKAGLEGLDSGEVSVVGIVEVAGKIVPILKAFRELKERLRSERFDALVLIDFPDFNLMFGKAAKKLGVPIVYYISPQVWAWRRGRIKKIARLVDKMLVVFPFEEEIYRKAGVDAEYVGHPLADSADCGLTKNGARKALGLSTDDTVVSLLPGSRTGEVKRLLPHMLKAGEILERKLGKKMVFLLPAADGISSDLLDGFLKQAPLGVRVLRKEMYTALRASDAAVVASGTAALETALIGTPMVIVYRVSSLSYVIGRMLIGVEYIGLPNIVAGRALVPELIQDKASPENIAGEVFEILRDGKKRDEMVKGFGEVKESLGGRGAADRAARAVYKVIAEGNR